VRIRISPSARGTSFQGVEGHIVGEVDGEWLVQLDGETRPMRFAKSMVGAVESPVRWCEPGFIGAQWEREIAEVQQRVGKQLDEMRRAATEPAPGYCPDDVPGGSAE
jgi:hypothetical protein